MTWLDDLTMDDVIVNTATGESFRGFKSSVYSDCIVLSETRMIQAEGISSKIQGEFVIPREVVSSIQLLPPEGR